MGKKKLLHYGATVSRDYLTSIEMPHLLLSAGQVVTRREVPIDDESAFLAMLSGAVGLYGRLLALAKLTPTVPESTQVSAKTLTGSSDEVPGRAEEDCFKDEGTGKV